MSDARPVPVDPLLATTHLSKWYGRVIGLNDVTVAIPPGITGLLGPNGAGKSTLLKLMTGQLRPSQGEVRVLGEPVWGNPGIFARIGYCPEQDAFHRHMTGRVWIASFLRLNGLSTQESADAAQQALEMFGLVPVAERAIGGYSQGTRQRLKMALAVAHEPELLVLDEPLTGMDPLTRRQVIQAMRDWARAGRSVIVSSHVLHEVEAMTSDILLLHQGRVLAEGNVHRIREMIDEHPHAVSIGSDRPRDLAREFLAYEDVVSLAFDGARVTVQTLRPDMFYTRLTTFAASAAPGIVQTVSSPDDNLKAVFDYLVTRS